MGPLEFTVVLGERFVEGQRAASIHLAGMAIFTEIVYDNEETPAEKNIVLLFKERLARLLREEG